MRIAFALCLFALGASGAGAAEPSAPSINVRIAEPEGSAATHRVTGTARDVARFLLATEERAQKNDELLAEAMTSTNAQMAEMAAAVDALLQARFGRT